MKALKVLKTTRPLLLLLLLLLLMSTTTSSLSKCRASSPRQPNDDTTLVLSTSARTRTRGSRPGVPLSHQVGLVLLPPGREAVEQAQLVLREPVHGHLVLVLAALLGEGAHALVHPLVAVDLGAALRSRRRRRRRRLLLLVVRCPRCTGVGVGAGAWLRLRLRLLGRRGCGRRAGYDAVDVALSRRERCRASVTVLGRSEHPPGKGEGVVNAVCVCRGELTWILSLAALGVPGERGGGGGAPLG
jgi:hypothetical protein